MKEYQSFKEEMKGHLGKMNTLTMGEEIKTLYGNLVANEHIIGCGIEAKWGVVGLFVLTNQRLVYIKEDNLVSYQLDRISQASMQKHRDKVTVHFKYLEDEKTMTVQKLNKKDERFLSELEGAIHVVDIPKQMESKKANDLPPGKDPKKVEPKTDMSKKKEKKIKQKKVPKRRVDFKVTGGINHLPLSKGNQYILKTTKEVGVVTINKRNYDYLGMDLEVVNQRNGGKAATGAVVGGLLTGGLGAIAGAAIGGRRRNDSVPILHLKDQATKDIFSVQIKPFNQTHLETLAKIEPKEER